MAMELENNCRLSPDKNADFDYKNMYEKSMQRLAVLSRIAETIALGNNSKDTWNKVLKEIVVLMNANTGSIYTLSEDGKRLYCSVEYSNLVDVKTAIVNGIDISLLEGMPIMDILRRGISIKLDNISRELNEELNIHNKNSPYDYKSSICSPIIIGSAINGAIAVSSKKSYCFNDDDAKVLDSIGYIIGTALYNDRLLVMLRDSKEVLAKAFTAASNARMAERMNLSRELHDEIGQGLTSLSLRLKALQQEHDLDVILDRINNLRFIINGIHKELKRILFDLRPSALEGNRMLDSLKRLTDQASCDGNITIQLEVPDGNVEIPPDMELIIYRCVQEGVTNIIKHSNATNAWVTFSLSENNILLEIKDNGIGLPEGAYSKGSGLTGMRDRVLEAGGVFAADSTKAGGTNISIMLPLMDNVSEGLLWKTV